MNKLGVTIFLIFCCSTAIVAQDYIFFLHNRFLEDHELTDEHPRYGRAAYQEIINAFEKEGFTVFSEKRKANTNSQLYAREVCTQIECLLESGVKSNHITVIGTSKGGYIAQYVSTFLKNPDVNFVFIGSYMQGDIERFPEINFCGNILCIYEETDTYATSAAKRKETSALPINHFKEIKLTTNLEHGFLFRALEEWITPSIQWAKRNYN